MATAKDQMKTIKEELERVRAEIGRLQLEEGVLTRLLAKINGEPSYINPPPRKRATNVKPFVLQIVGAMKDRGITSAEVATAVREQMPEVTKETVGSILSRLKADGAFAYVGERYYEKQYAPTEPPRPFDGLRSVG